MELHCRKQYMNVIYWSFEDHVCICTIADVYVEQNRGKGGCRRAVQNSEEIPDGG